MGLWCGVRIISGRYKSKKLISPPGDEKTRPLPDRVKLAVFNILRGHVEGEAVFDGFSGSGAIGLECASRGASRVVMVEQDKKIAGVVRQNIEMLGASPPCELVVGDALGSIALSRCPDPVHLVFLDPPYKLVREKAGWNSVRAQAAKLIGRLDDKGFAVIRTPWPFVHPVDVTPAPAATGVEVIDLAQIGDDELDRLDAATGAAKPEKADAELSIEGAVGPETHVYRHTAVHLYMRDGAAHE